MSVAIPTPQTTQTPPLLTHRVLPNAAKTVRAELAALAKAVKGAGTLACGAKGPAVEALQKLLAGVGVYDGKTTGLYDAATIAAVSALQKRAGLKVTGMVDGAEAQAIKSKELFVAKDFEKEHAKVGQKGADIAEVERKLKDLGFKPDRTDGVFDKNTLKALLAYRKADKSVPDGYKAIGNRVITGLRRQVVSLEKNLKTLGRDVGKVDSNYTEKTRKAVAAFQKKHGLPATGIADAKTRAAIAKAVKDRAVPTNTGAGSTWKPDVPPSKFQKGYDLSHWQSSAQFNDVLNNPSTRFIGIKATDGTSYTDPTFKARWDAMGKKLQPGKFDMRLAYHFLEPGNGTAQANHFLDVLGIHGPLKPGTRLALDWEASALSSPQTLKDAAKRIHDVTGTWPLVYCSASRVPQARGVVPNCPLWAAHWPPSAEDYKNPFVQTGGNGIDTDVFAGSEAALRRWAGWK